MGHHLNALEKELLIKRYRTSPDAKINLFCQANNISPGAFRQWMEQYDKGGIEALYRASKDSHPLLSEGTEGTEENYRRRVIELTIENERLNKNYTAMKVNGNLEYKALKKKTSE